MIIDFVNYTLYHPGAEASILFHLHEYGLRVPRFFCIPEQYEPEELDAYFAMHFQDVLQYHVWMTATIVVSENKTDRTEWMPNCKADLPVYTNVKKYALYRNIERILESRESYRQKIAAAESVSPEQVQFHIIIQEARAFTEFAVLNTIQQDGILNETQIQIGCGWDSELVWNDTPTITMCYHNTDQLLYYGLPAGMPPPENDFLRELEKAAQILFTKFDIQMQVSIFVDPESHHLFALTVRQTTLSSEESILFDSRSILSAFYPTTCTPLMGSYMQNMYNHVIHGFFKTTLHLFDRPYSVSDDMDDIVIYINGRLYFCVEHWNKLLYYFPTFQKKQSFKNVYALLHDRDGIRSWMVHRYIDYIGIRLMHSNFKAVQEKLQLLENRVQVYQSYDLSRMSLSELNQYYKRFQNTNIACWHYTLLSVLNSRISIQHLKKSLRKAHPDLPSGIQYQYAAGMLPMPDWAGKKLRKKIRCTQKSETYRKQFLKLQDQLVKLLADLFLAAGNRLYEAGAISDVDDVHYLVLKEVLASMEDPSIQWKDNRPTWRREAYRWYLNLPNYTEMVLQKKRIGQQEEPLTHMVFPSGSGKTQGRPCMPGLSKGDILIYDGKQPLSEEQAVGKIIITAHLSKFLMSLPLKGLILEEELTCEQVSAQANPRVCFPVLSGVRGACSLFQHTQQIYLNGWTGEITASREQTSEKTKTLWSEYRSRHQ